MTIKDLKRKNNARLISIYRGFLPIQNQPVRQVAAWSFILTWFTALIDLPWLELCVRNGYQQLSVSHLKTCSREEKKKKVIGTIYKEENNHHVCRSSNYIVALERLHLCLTLYYEHVEIFFFIILFSFKFNNKKKKKICYGPTLMIEGTKTRAPRGTKIKLI